MPNSAPGIVTAAELIWATFPLAQARMGVEQRMVASPNCCKFVAALRFPGASLSGGRFLVEGVWVELSVFDSVEVLAVDLGERRAVAGVGDE